MRFQVSLLVALVLVLSTGCQASPAEPGNIPPLAPTTQGETEPMTPPMPPANAQNIDTLIGNAKADLAKKLSIPETEISLVEARSVTWSDSSLGCPQPGMMYADVLTPGFLILLNANGREYEYHASTRTDVFHCENPVPPVPGALDDI